MGQNTSLNEDEIRQAAANFGDEFAAIYPINFYIL
jgi:hypothetical protein